MSTPTSTTVMSSPNPSLLGEPVTFTVDVVGSPPVTSDPVTIVQSAQASATGTSVIVSLGGAPTVGNTLVAFGGCGLDASNLTYAEVLPSGFTVLGQFSSGNGGFGACSAVGFRVVQAGDGADWTFTKPDTSVSGAPNDAYVLEILGTPGIVASADFAGFQMAGQTGAVTTGPVNGGPGTAIVGFWQYFAGTYASYLGGYSTPGFAVADNIADLSSSAVPASQVVALLHSPASSPPNEDGQVAYIAVFVYGSGLVTLTGSESPPEFPAQALYVASGAASYSTDALAVGSHTITADYEGDQTYAPSSGDVIQQVNLLPIPVVSIMSGLDPSVSGNGVSFAVTVDGDDDYSPPAAPTGTVVLSDSYGDFSPPTIALSGGEGTSGPLVFVTIGVHTVRADYGGDSQYAAATGFADQEVDASYVPAMSLSSSLDPSPFGQAFTLTATVTPPAGVGFVPTGTVTLSGDQFSPSLVLAMSGGHVPTYTMPLISPWPVGNHLVTAAYSGDSHFAPASVSMWQLVLNGVVVVMEDLPGFALLATYLATGDEGLPPWATFAAVPDTVAPGAPVYVLWSSANVATVRISGADGASPPDSYDTGLLPSGAGSGIYEFAGGFLSPLALTCEAFDAHGNLVATQSLPIIVSLLPQIFLVNGG